MAKSPRPSTQLLRHILDTFQQVAAVRINARQVHPFTEQRVPFRVPEQTRRRAEERAYDEGRSVSEAAREAPERYPQPDPRQRLNPQAIRSADPLHE